MRSESSSNFGRMRRSGRPEKPRAGADPVLWGLRCPEGTPPVCQDYLPNRVRPKSEASGRDLRAAVSDWRVDGAG